MIRPAPSHDRRAYLMRWVITMLPLQAMRREGRQPIARGTMRSQRVLWWSGSGSFCSLRFGKIQFQKGLLLHALGLWDFPQTDGALHDFGIEAGRLGLFVNFTDVSHERGFFFLHPFYAGEVGAQLSIPLGHGLALDFGFASSAYISVSALTDGGGINAMIGSASEALLGLPLGGNILVVPNSQLLKHFALMVVPCRYVLALLCLRGKDGAGEHDQVALLSSVHVVRRREVIPALYSRFPSLLADILGAAHASSPTGWNVGVMDATETRVQPTAAAKTSLHLRACSSDPDHASERFSVSFDADQ